MDINEFEAKVLPACRTKHLYILNPDEPEKFSLTRKLRSLSGKNTQHINTANKVPYFLPKANVVPREFVRLEPWEIWYLFMLASKAKLGIIETGRFNGGSVVVMSCANSNVPIFSIDIAPQNDTRLKEILSVLQVGSNVQLITGDSQKTKYQQITPVDLLFIDGDHTYDGCMNDLKNWYDMLVEGGHVVLHDCYYGGEGVQEAVIDFIREHDVEIVVSPYKFRNHYRYPEGSFCHFIKR